MAAFTMKRFLEWISRLRCIGFDVKLPTVKLSNIIIAPGATWG